MTEYPWRVPYYLLTFARRSASCICSTTVRPTARRKTCRDPVAKSSRGIAHVFAACIALVCALSNNADPAFLPHIRAQRMVAGAVDEHGFNPQIFSGLFGSYGV